MLYFFLRAFIFSPIIFFTISPMIFYIIKSWKVFLYYSLFVLISTYIFAYVSYIDIINPCTEGNGAAEAIGLFILWCIVAWTLLNFLIRLSLFILASKENPVIRREMFSSHTKKVLFYSIILVIIWSVSYYTLNDPFQPYRGDNIRC
jgi:hypothetical protein